MSSQLHARLQELVAAGGLPALSDTALEVLRLCRAEPATLGELAAAVAGDPRLARVLLGFASSPTFGIGAEVRELQRAALVLGLRNVELLALALALLEAVPRSGARAGLDCALFWRRALVRATCARTLAGVCGGQAQDEAVARGRRGEGGRSARAQALAGRYEPVLREARRRGSVWPSAELERELLGFDHLDVGVALLAGRELLPHLARGVELARDPRAASPDAPPELVQLARVLWVAADVADLFTLAPSAITLERVHARAREGLGLGGRQLASILEALEEASSHAAELLEIDAPPGRLAEVLAAARAGQSA